MANPIGSGDHLGPLIRKSMFFGGVGVDPNDIVNDVSCKVKSMPRPVLLFFGAGR